MPSLDRELTFFRARQEELASKHHGKYALIHEEHIEGLYDSELAAYTAAKKKYSAGTFLIRRCLRPEEESTQVFHSRVV